MSVLTALLVISCSVVVVIVTAVVTPVQVKLLMQSAPHRRLTLAARLFGGITPSIPIHDSTRERARRRPLKESQLTSRRERGKTTLRNRRMLFAAPQLVDGLLRSIKLTSIEVDGDIGLGDPADTGQFLGLLVPIKYALPPSSVVSVDVRPDFTARRLSGRFVAEFAFVPVALVLPCARFAWRVFGAADG
ncbi:MAG: DUF2953 domain-containing protein [Hyphomicrobiaceae bacterium]